MYLFLFSLQVQELSKDDSNGKEGLIVFFIYFEEKTEKLWFSDYYIFATQCSIPFKLWIQIKHVLSLKYQRFTPSGCKYIARLENQCLWQKLSYFHGLETKLITLLKL